MDISEHQTAPQIATKEQIALKLHQIGLSSNTKLEIERPILAWRSNSVKIEWLISIWQSDFVLINGKIHQNVRDMSNCLSQRDRAIAYSFRNYGGNIEWN